MRYPARVAIRRIAPCAGCTSIVVTRLRGPPTVATISWPRMPEKPANTWLRRRRFARRQGRNAMKAASIATALASSLLVATALTPLHAADMTNERELNPQREPQNWILHHGNYQGHRFSALKEINADNVKNLKPAFTVGLSGLQSGGRYAHGNLEATPLVEDGIMYVPDGWGSF